jgi:hypothetical protein
MQPKVLVDVHTATTTTPGDTQLDVTIYNADTSKYVTLGDGDVLTAHTDKDPNVTLSSNTDAFGATFPDDKSTLLTLSFTRAHGTSAPSSTVPLPPALALTSPAAGATVSYASGSLTFAWSNPVANGTITFNFERCGSGSVAVGYGVQRAPDTGAYTFPWSDVPLSQAPPSQPECIDVHVERGVDGSVDPAFNNGGFISATRFQALQVMVGP